MNEEFPSQSLFLHIWNTEYPHLKIPKAIRMGKCDVCEKYDHLIANEKSKQVVKKLYDARLSHHLKFQQERDWLTVLTMTAQDYPSTVHYICTDYMNPIKLPHFCELPKSCFSKRRPKMEVFGLVDWSTKARSYATHFNWWKHDANMNISLLFSHLRTVRLQGYRSAKLLLNTDNCFRDNKNKYTFAFLLMLVHYGWYDTIEFHLMMPGHSHFCVDRDCFACIGKRKWKSNCPTMEAFWATFLPLCIKGTDVIPPSQLQIPAVWDWKSFFTPCLNKISGYAHVRSFKFQRDPHSNSVVMYYKLDMLKPAWKGFLDDFGFQVLNTIPQGFPNIIPPTPIPPSEFTDITHFHQFMTQHSINHWDKFIVEQFPPDAFQQQYTDFWCQHVHNPIVEEEYIPPAVE